MSCDPNKPKKKPKENPNCKNGKKRDPCETKCPPPGVVTNRVFQTPRKLISQTPYAFSSKPSKFPKLEFSSGLPEEIGERQFNETSKKIKEKIKENDLYYEDVETNFTKGGDGGVVPPTPPGTPPSTPIIIREASGRPIETSSDLGPQPDPSANVFWTSKYQWGLFDGVTIVPPTDLEWDFIVEHARNWLETRLKLQWPDITFIEFLNVQKIYNADSQDFNGIANVSYPYKIEYTLETSYNDFLNAPSRVEEAQYLDTTVVDNIRLSESIQNVWTLVPSTSLWWELHRAKWDSSVTWRTYPVEPVPPTQFVSKSMTNNEIKAVFAHQKPSLTAYVVDQRADLEFLVTFMAACVSDEGGMDWQTVIDMYQVSSPITLIEFEGTYPGETVLVNNNVTRIWGMYRSSQKTWLVAAQAPLVYVNRPKGNFKVLWAN